MKRIVATVHSSDDPRELSRRLSQTSQAYNEHAMSVRLPDGSFVFGYYIEEETLNDGNKEYNVILKTD